MIRITVSRVQRLRIGLTTLCTAMLCAILFSPLAWSDDYTAQRIEPAESGFLAFIPKMINATPDVFPAQSNDVRVAPMTETQENSWLDHQQRNIRDWADDTSQSIDEWFGEADPNRPASATIRVLLDQSWNPEDGYEVKPRIRGKIRLPSLERRLSLVFGDDRLDDEFSNNVANPSTQNSANGVNSSNTANTIKAPETTTATLNNPQVREDNSSVALRLSHWSKKLPFDSDLDLGLRSGSDVYIRGKVAKSWVLDNDFRFDAAQIYRYGRKSRNYWRTNLELSHNAAQKAQLSDQFNITIADNQADDIVWENRTFRQHQFYKNQRFNYGIYTGGYDNSGNLRLNSWGPFTSWRQPLWREWFYVQAELNYFNDHRADRSHDLSTFVRLETLF